MKSLWNAIAIVLVLNFLVVLGLVVWLRASDRLSAQRIRQTYQTFKPTVQEEKRQREEAARKAEEEAQLRAEARRLDLLDQTPNTVADRLADQQQSGEVALQNVTRLQRDIQNLQQQLELAKRVVAQQRAELAAQRAAFEEAVAQQAKLNGDADFAKAVSLYEQLPPKQAKVMFQQLLSQQKMPVVVDYLAAMQLRKAAAVLKEFKGTPEEVAQATALVQHLRLRGIDLLPGMPPGVPRQPAGTSKALGADAAPATQPTS